MTVESEGEQRHGVEFFPTYGLRTTDGRWKVGVRGWVFESSDQWRWRRRFVRLLRRGLRLAPHQQQSELFTDRVTPFLVSGLGGHRVKLRVGDREFELPESSETGHVKGTFHLSEEMLGDSWVDFTADSGEQVTCRGRARLLESEGLSVVSDVDDTIKHSNITVRRELLANTFLRRFHAVPGMADLYRAWEARGAAFHYVSNSPWQLTSLISQFVEECGFPAGSVHLRPFRVRKGGLRNFLKNGEDRKRETLRFLLDDFPGRRFVLVGDTSERDPEIYGDLARTRGEQITGILVRNVTGEPVDSERLRRAFVDVRPERVRVFREPETLADLALA